MALYTQTKGTKGSRNVRLYTLVFASRKTIAAIFLLLISFMIQPFHQAMAADPEPEKEEQEVSVVPIEEVEESEPESEQEAGPAEAEPIQEIEDELLNDSTEEDNEIEETSNGTEEPANQTPNTSNDPKDNLGSTSTPNLPSDENNENSTSTENIATSTDTNTGGGGPALNDNNDPNTDSGTSTPPVEVDTGTTTSTTTDETNQPEPPESETPDIENPTPAPNDDSATNEDVGDDIIEEGVDGIVKEVVNLTRQLVTEENFYQFSRQSCVPVGDGTYHCTNKDAVIADTNTAVYADQDEDGDTEIYMRTSKGDVQKVTDNEYDDSAPHFDSKSMQIVWQRMIDGRYQVMSYDVRTKKETQLTFTKTNNMEPKASEEGVVWQTWDGEDWEIMFFDGKVQDQITDNNVQDVTPAVEDGYILWSILGGEEQEARVYSIESGEILTISGYEGGTISNPRFVLVYDTKFDNGDIVTQGFDPVTGLSKPISAKPADEPIDIPTPDPVGEIRALIQNKSNQKENDVVTKATSDTGSSTDLTLNLHSTSTDDTLNLNQISPDIDVDSNATTTESVEFELEEYDLVITPESVSTTSNPANQEVKVGGTKSASSTGQ